MSDFIDAWVAGIKASRTPEGQDRIARGYARFLPADGEARTVEEETAARLHARLRAIAERSAASRTKTTK